MATDLPPRFRVWTGRTLAKIPQLQGLDAERLETMLAVAAVLPFRVNSHVLDLIDWARLDQDPIWRLTFPDGGMLDPDDLERMRKLVGEQATPARIEAEARDIRRRLNPHPGGQLTDNVPELDGRPLVGLQHKYPETVLLFPGQGQTCHTYCAYCFRWAQFVGEPDLRMATGDPGLAPAYLRAHPDVTDLLVTGGDPMVMRTQLLARWLEPLLDRGLPLETIRIGTKSLAWWPYRYTHDDDADELLRLFERVVAAGRRLVLVAHCSHPHELEPEVTRRALAKVRGTGASVYVQGPLVRGVNDDPATWAALWRTAAGLGAVPYYLFVERDTGPRNWFEVPLVRGWEIYRDALASVSGLARTVRGPVMSATPGKVAVDGVTQVAGRRLLALRYLQARDPARVGRPFHAVYDDRACWLDQLRPAFSEDRAFFAP